VSGAAIWPLAPAFQSREPLMRDTMSIPQWVRWVLLPRLREMVTGVTPAPTQSQLCTLARDLAKDEATWPLLYALGELDDLFVTSLADAPREAEELKEPLAQRAATPSRVKYAAATMPGPCESKERVHTARLWAQVPPRARIEGGERA
jgi:uncharacterized protein YqcC (DUF446 family)